MNSQSLDRAQIEKLTRTVQRQLSFLNRLTGRMAQRHFPKDDPLHMAARRTQDAVDSLFQVLRELQKS